jgi:hypothetical protein
MPPTAPPRPRFLPGAVALLCATLWAAGAIALTGLAATPVGSTFLWRLAGQAGLSGLLGEQTVRAQEAGQPASDAMGVPCGPATPVPPTAPEASAPPAPPAVPAIPELSTPVIPSIPEVATPAPAAPGGSPSSSPLQATFRLCGGADVAAARAIEQLIAGRGFSAHLTGRPDGCADLAIDVAAAGGGAGRQSTNLSVSSGSTNNAPGRRVAVQIVSENGTTQVSLS